MRKEEAPDARIGRTEGMSDSGRGDGGRNQTNNGRYLLVGRTGYSYGAFQSNTEDQDGRIGNRGLAEPVSI